MSGKIPVHRKLNGRVHQPFRCVTAVLLWWSVFVGFPAGSAVLAVDETSSLESATDLPIVFASFSGSFSTLNAVLPREKWECLNETQGGAASVYSSLYHMHRAAVESKALRPKDGFLVEWAFVPDTRAVICICTQSLSPAGHQSSRRSIGGLFDPNPDEDGYTIFQWGGYLSRPRKVTSVTLSIPPGHPDALRLEPAVVRRWLMAFSDDFVGADESGELRVRVFPSRIPEEIRKFWVATIEAGLTPYLQKRDAEGDATFQSRGDLVRLGQDGINCLLYEVDSISMAFWKAERSKESKISFNLKSVPGSALERWIATAPISHSSGQIDGDSEVASLAVSLSVPQRIGRVLVSVALQRFSAAAEAVNGHAPLVTEMKVSEIRSLAGAMIRESRLQCTLRCIEFDQSTQVNVRVGHHSGFDMANSLLQYLTAHSALTIDQGVLNINDITLNHVTGIRTDSGQTELGLLCGANSDSIVVSVLNGPKEFEQVAESVSAFLETSDPATSSDGVRSGLTGSFRANRVLPVVCALLDPTNRRTYDRANWKSAGDMDAARMTSNWENGAITLSVDFQEEAFLWTFTTFMNLVRQVQGIEHRIYWNFNKG